MTNDPDELLFADEEETALPAVPETAANAWTVMIVDDEQSVHDVTRFALGDLRFAGRDLRFVDAYSGVEAIELLQKHPDTALILLDVVMESDDAGLRVAQRIREDMDNQLVRIVLRTGQPGQAPERHVILNYDINDYKEKTELTAEKLFSTVISSLRSYRDLKVIEKNRQGLERIIQASPDLFRMQSMQNFVSGVMMQVVSLLGMGDNCFISKTEASGFFCLDDSEQNLIMAATGTFQPHLHESASAVVDQDILAHMKDACLNQHNIYFDNQCIIYLKNPSGHANLVYFSGCGHLDEIDRSLIEVFCSNVSVAFENLHLHHEIERSQKEIINTLGTVAEFRSNEMGNHITRVAEYSALLAQQSGLDKEQVEVIRLASPMHDIGKIGIPDQILHKPGSLTEEEFEVMKRHAEIGYQMLKSSERPILKAAAIIAQQHQEKWDGSGYPSGLEGEDIHVYGRITAVADVFDALSSRRVYKHAWELGEVLDYFKQQRGTHFDPRLVDLFIENINDYLEIQQSYRDEGTS